MFVVQLKTKVILPNRQVSWTKASKLFQSEVNYERTAVKCAGTQKCVQSSPAVDSPTPQDSVSEPPIWRRVSGPLPGGCAYCPISYGSGLWALGALVTLNRKPLQTLKERLADSQGVRDDVARILLISRWTQVELANALFVCPQSITNWMSGHRVPPPLLKHKVKMVLRRVEDSVRLRQKATRLTAQEFGVEEIL